MVTFKSLTSLLLLSRVIRGKNARIDKETFLKKVGICIIKKPRVRDAYQQSFLNNPLAERKVKTVYL